MHPPCSHYLFAVVIMLSASNALGAADRGDLLIRFHGFDNNHGEFGAYIVNRPEQFLAPRPRVVRKLRRAIANEQVTWLIRDLPFGHYAIASFHDENNNNRYDLNALGIPVEAYGFSNNVRGRFSAPDFEDARFVFNRSGQTLEIEVADFSLRDSLTGPAAGLRNESFPH